MMIALEGPDGSGKSTQLRLLEERLRESGKICTIVPGCSDRPIGKYVRRCLSGEVSVTPQELQSLYTADRMARDSFLRVHLAGEILLADRWTMSALVYGALDCESDVSRFARREWLVRINASIIVPHIYIVLAVAGDVAWERVERRKQAREIYEHKAAVERACEAYRGDDVVRRVREIGSQVWAYSVPMAPEATAERIWNDLAPYLKIA